jgi:phosphoribosylpyrophosphate synthetase
MELLLMIDAAKRASARHITVINLILMGWGKTGSDRSKLTAKLLETAGATRVMTMDLHADQIQGFLKTSRSLLALPSFTLREKFRIRQLDYCFSIWEVQKSIRLLKF